MHGHLRSKKSNGELLIRVACAAFGASTCGSILRHGRPEPPFGVGHSTISEKSSPCLSEGTILTHMVPDLAKWQIRVGGVLLFGASERPLNHPGVDLDDPIVPMPKDGAHRDGQIPQFYVK